MCWWVIGFLSDWQFVSPLVLCVFVWSCTHLHFKYRLSLSLSFCLSHLCRWTLLSVWLWGFDVQVTANSYRHDTPCSSSIAMFQFPQAPLLPFSFHPPGALGLSPLSQLFDRSTHLQTCPHLLCSCLAFLTCSYFQGMGYQTTILLSVPTELPLHYWVLILVKSTFQYLGVHSWTIDIKRDDKTWSEATSSLTFAFN